MSMTFEQMIEECQEATGNTSSGFQSIIERVLNRKRRLVFKLHKGSALEAAVTLDTVAGQSSYDLDSTVGYIDKAFGEDGRELTTINEAIFRRMYGTLESETGTPTYIRQYGRDTSRGLTVKLWRVPESAESLTLLTYTQPAWLSLSTDVSEFDDAFDDVVINQAIAQLQLTLNDDLVGTSAAMARQSLQEYKGSDRNLSGGNRVYHIAPDPMVELRRGE